MTKVTINLKNERDRILELAKNAKEFSERFTQTKA